MLEIGELRIRFEPAPRAYIASSLRFWNEKSDVRLIEPFTVASTRKSSPVKVNVPPGGPEVIPSTPTRASFVTPLLLRSMVGSPVSERLWNLKTAMGRWFGSAKNCVSRVSAVSKAEVEPNAHSVKAPSRVAPRYILPKSVRPLVLIEGSVVMVVPLVMRYGFGEVMVAGVPNLLGVGVGGGVVD